MKSIIISLILSVSGLWAASATERVPDSCEWQEVDGVTIPIPPAEHPRLYIRENGIAELKARMQTPQGREILGKLRECAVPMTQEEEDAVQLRDFRYYFKMRGVTSKVQLQALDHLVNRDQKQARAAITSMLDTLKRTNFDTKHDRTRASGVMLMVGAMVYDWCYDQMTPEERQAYIEEFIRIAGTMECGYPPKANEPIAGHASEWNILRDMLSAGIAVYDEYPDMYNYVATMIFRDYVPPRNFIYSGHNYHQGTGYVTVRYLNDLISLWIFDRMGAGPIYDPSQQFVLYDFIYRRRPDGHVLPAGDANPANRRSPQTYAMPAMLAASYYGDAYLMNEYFMRPSIEPHLLMMQLLWMDFDLKPKTPEDLPLTRYSGTPFGWMIARTGWGEDAVIAEMKVNEHFVGNHQHLDGGAFQIYYKGPLAIDSGMYQGSSGNYNSPHCKNYFKRTIAHNSLLVYDPDEKFACWNYGGSDRTEFAANDGGQRMPGDKWDTCRSFEDLLSDSYTVGKALAHSFGPDPAIPDYSYLKGDITKAYSDKVRNVRRSFVFLNMKDEAIPAVLLVYDHVESSDPAFKKYWLLHSIEKPVVKGQEFTVSRTLDGDSGMLHNTVLLPAKDDADIEIIGGPGKDCWVFGENYPNEPTRRPDPARERGEWRVEVSPQAESEENCFFNVMQIAGTGCRNFHKLRKIEGENVCGVVISDRVVLFSKDLKEKESLSFNFKGSGEYRILVTDLQPGTWQVSRNGKLIIPEIEVQAEDGTLYFEGKPGTYELSTRQ